MILCGENARNLKSWYFDAENILKSHKKGDRYAVPQDSADHRSVFYIKNKILPVDGARQVGKTYIIRYVGSGLFSNVIELNMVEDSLQDRLFANKTACFSGCVILFLFQCAKDGRQTGRLFKYCAASSLVWKTMMFLSGQRASRSWIKGVLSFGKALI